MQTPFVYALLGRPVGPSIKWGFRPRWTRSSLATQLPNGAWVTCDDYTRGLEAYNLKYMTVCKIYGTHCVYRIERRSGGGVMLQFFIGGIKHRADGPQRFDDKFVKFVTRGREISVNRIGKWRENPITRYSWPCGVEYGIILSWEFEVDRRIDFNDEYVPYRHDGPAEIYPAAGPSPN